MTVRQPPRTTTGLTGLGAVGGPTGVGAGALRVVVEFLTQYDADRVKQLEDDLKRLDNLQQLSGARDSKINKARLKDEAQLAQILQDKLTLSSEEAKVIKRLRDLSRSSGDEKLAQYKSELAAAVKDLELSQESIESLINEDRIRAEIAAKEHHRRELERAEKARSVAISKDQVQVERTLFSIEQLRATLLPKLGALALGAAGGAILGTVLSATAFAAVSAVLGAAGEALQDIIDPARHAREEIGGVADEITRLGEAAQNPSLRAGAVDYLKELGDVADHVNPQFLVQAANIAKANEALEKYGKLADIINNLPQLRTEAIRTAFEAFAGEEIDKSKFDDVTNAILHGAEASKLSAEDQKLLADAINYVDTYASKATGSVSGLATVEQLSASAAQRAAYAQQQLADSLQSISDLRIQGIQDQIDALSDTGPSILTKALAGAIEAAGEAQADANYQTQLGALAQERYLLLLQQRIRYEGAAVNLSQVSGEAALVVIDERIRALQRAGFAEQAALDAVSARLKALQKADQEQDRRDKEVLKTYDDKIAAIRKEGEAQDRVNKLLDIQYKLGQQNKRQSGESIGDFLKRRANEERQLLAERDSALRQQAIAKIQAERDAVAAIQEEANARREAAIEAVQLEQEKLQAALQAAQKARAAAIQALQDQRERIQLEVQLEKNAERTKQLERQETQRKALKALQEKLQKSQEADRKETESRKKALQEQIDAERRRTQEALKWAKVEESQKLAIAALGATSLRDVNTLIGELSGASRALAELKAYAKANGIPYSEVPGLIDLIKNVNIAQGKVDAILRRTYGNIPEGAAAGGVFELSNARSPFGSNIRLGEQGKEIGVVLSNRVAKVLQESQRPQLGEQTFIINRSTDPYADQQRFKRVVKETFEEALR